jgi:hypothetical protein
MKKIGTAEVHEIDIAGKHVTVQNIGGGDYASTVSGKVHNSHGVHVATPIWQNIGNEEETKEWIKKTVKNWPD